MTGFPITRRTWLIPAACLLFILFFTVFGERGLLRIYEMKREKESIDRSISELNTENQKLRLSIEALRNDPHHLERIARKELGLVRPNEVVYQFASPDAK